MILTLKLFKSCKFNNCWMQCALYGDRRYVLCVEESVTCSAAIVMVAAFLYKIKNIENNNI